MLAVLRNWEALNYVANKTHDICLAAVRQNYRALKIIDMQTDELCSLAMKHTPEALEFVNREFQTLEMCISAVQYNYLLLRFVKNLRQSVCMVAFEINPMALEMIPVEFHTIEMYDIAFRKSIELLGIANQTREVCELAMQINPRAIKYMNPLQQTLKYAMSAVRYDGKLLEFVANKTPEICAIAIQNTPQAVLFTSARNQNKRLCISVVKENGMLLLRIAKRMRTPELYQAAVENTWNVLKYIDDAEQTEKMCYSAVLQDSQALKYAAYKSPRILRAASQNNDAQVKTSFSSGNNCSGTCYLVKFSISLSDDPKFLVKWQHNTSTDAGQCMLDNIIDDYTVRYERPEKYHMEIFDGSTDTFADTLNFYNVTRMVDNDCIVVDNRYYLNHLLCEVDKFKKMYDMRSVDVVFIWHGNVYGYAIYTL
jgi:hypothetical protein